MLLIDEILSSKNIGIAMDSVVKNNGSAGVDDMDACELPMWWTGHGQETENQIRAMKYKPLPVRRVYIPKPKARKDHQESQLQKPDEALQADSRRLRSGTDPSDSQFQAGTLQNCWHVCNEFSFIPKSPGNRKREAAWTGQPSEVLFIENKSMRYLLYNGAPYTRTVCTVQWEGRRTNSPLYPIVCHQKNSCGKQEENGRYRQGKLEVFTVWKALPL